MGQKTNPNILQLSKTNSWDSNYIEKKSKELALLTSRNIEIKKFIYKFFLNKGLIIQNCRINQISNNLDIFISYYQSNNSFILIDEINKEQKIKFVKNHSIILKNQTKNINSLLKTVKNTNNYESLLYKRDLKEKQNNLFKKSFNVKRLSTVNLYKKYLNIKLNKNRTNSVQNDLIEHLFQGLNLFFKTKLVCNLILKPIFNNSLSEITKQRHYAVKRTLVKLKKYQRNDFFKEGLNLIGLTTNTRNSASLISNYIATNLSKLKRHNFFLRFVISLLTTFISKGLSKTIQGIKIKIKGRLNGAPRAKHKIVVIGKNISIIKLDSTVNYSESTSYTINGTIGVKIWVCEKTLN